MSGSRVLLGVAVPVVALVAVCLYLYHRQQQQQEEQRRRQQEGSLDTTLLHDDDEQCQHDTAERVPVEPVCDTAARVPVEPVHDTAERVPVEPVRDTAERVPVEPVRDTAERVPVEPVHDTAERVPVEPVRDTAERVPVEPVRECSVADSLTSSVNVADETCAAVDSDAGNSTARDNVEQGDSEGTGLQCDVLDARQTDDSSHCDSSCISGGDNSTSSTADCTADSSTLLNNTTECSVLNDVTVDSFIFIQQSCGDGGDCRSEETILPCSSTATHSAAAELPVNGCMKADGGDLEQSAVNSHIVQDHVVSESSAAAVEHFIDNNTVSQASRSSTQCSAVSALLSTGDADSAVSDSVSRSSCCHHVVEEPLSCSPSHEPPITLHQLSSDQQHAQSSTTTVTDNLSEQSSDSGKGGSSASLEPTTASSPATTDNIAVDDPSDSSAVGVVSAGSQLSQCEQLQDEQMSSFEFLLPQKYCGRLIGRHGVFVNMLKERTGVDVWVRSHPCRTSFKNCLLEGRPSDVKACLALIRKKFPASQYPSITLEPVDSMSNLPVAIPNSHQLHLPHSASCSVLLASVVSPEQVFVQQRSHPTFCSLPLLSAQLQQLYGGAGENGAARPPPVPRPVPATSVLVAACPAVGWCRARCVSYNVVDDTVLAQRLDHGGYVNVPADACRQIHMSFMSVPFLAEECYLANVAPLTEGGWPAGSGEMMRELIGDRALEAIVVGTAADERALINLYIVQTTEFGNTAATLVNQMLVDRGLARFVEFDSNM